MIRRHSEDHRQKLESFWRAHRVSAFRCFFPFLFAAFFTSSSWASQEVFLLMNFDYIARLNRVKTDDEHSRPLGYARDCRPSEDFLIDNLRNIRLFYVKPGSEDFKVPGHICRQVFDGLGFHAETGMYSAQIQDQRGLLDESFVAAPVYRPRGAPFSAGPGVVTEPSLAVKALIEGETEQVEGRNWYVIPNGSWYQSWHKTSDDKSFKILYDNWKYRVNQVIESYDYRPGVSFDRIAGVVEDRHMIRTAVSGAMERLEDDGALTSHLHKAGGYSIFHYRPATLDHGDLFFYSWWGNYSGSLLKNGEPCDVDLVVESLDADKRFSGVMATESNSYTVYVVGTDVLRLWLANHGHDEDAHEAECTLAAFSRNDVDGNLYMYAYSRPNMTIYRFQLNGSHIKAPDIIRSEQGIDAITVDRSGNLYFTIQVAMPRNPDLNGFMTQGFAGLEFESFSGSEHYTDSLPTTVNATFDRLRGRMNFVQRFYQQVYFIGYNSYFPQYVSEVALVRRRFSSDFVLNGITAQEIPADYRDIIELAAKHPHQLSELKEHEDKPDSGSGLPLSVKLTDF